jgi:hypothetical protein
MVRISTCLNEHSQQLLQLYTTVNQLLPQKYNNVEKFISGDFWKLN